jgi:hypothetical protein
MKARICSYPIGILLFLIIPPFSAAEMPSVSLSNSIRYGFGDETINRQSTHRDYLEEKLSFNVYQDHFLIGGRLDYDKPAEFGFDHRELRKYYIEYRKGSWKIRGGSFAALFSRGMVLNCYAEDTIGHDSEITGFDALYETESTTVNILAGQVDYETIPDFDSIVTFHLGGISVRRKLQEHIALGGSVIKSDVVQEIGFYRVEDRFHALNTEVWSEIDAGPVEFYSVVASGVQGDNHPFEGDKSVYLSLNYSLSKTGMSLEYKNYRFGLSTPDKWNIPLYRKRMYSFQNPPTAVREHSWTLLSRRIHAVNFNDEVGMQMDIYHAVSPETMLNFNGSMAGRQYRYVMNIDGTFIRQKDRMSRLPSFSREFSPFWQVYGEFEHHFPKGSSLTGGIAYTSETTYLYYTPDLTERKRSFITPLKVLWQLPDAFSVEGVAEYQRFKENNHGDRYYTNTIFSAGVGKAPYFSAGFTAEYVSKGYEMNGRTLWLDGSVRFHCRTSHVFEIGYGETRGGLVCTNGRCRYVPAFEGWRLSAEMNY